jgi:hypothetical protein
MRVALKIALKKCRARQCDAGKNFSPRGIERVEKLFARALAPIIA